MKRKLAACLALCLLCIPGLALAMPEVTSHSACVIDVDSGRILAGKNENQQAEPASITKILTALVALENADISQVVTIPAAAAGVEGSSLYIKAGEQYSLEDLLYGLMMRSGNDAATAIALTVGGSVERFVEMMNEKARQLGCTGTHFNNPHGLPDENHYTTAHDMALITAAALRNETFAKIVATKNYVMEPDGAGERRSLQNKNKLLWQYDGAIGVKTGYTKSAGKTYVGAAERNGVRVAVVVLGASDMWGDAMTLLDDAFASYTTAELIADGQSTGVTPVLNGLTSEVEGITQGALTKTMTTEEKERVVIKCVYESPLSAPILQGEIIGSMQAFLDDEMIGSVPVVAKAPVEAYDLEHCWDKIIKQWLTNLVP